MLDEIGGIGLTSDIDRILKERGIVRSALAALNAMHRKGDVDVIYSCLSQCGGRPRIWVKYQ